MEKTRIESHIDYCQHCRRPQPCGHNCAEVVERANMIHPDNFLSVQCYHIQFGNSQGDYLNEIFFKTQAEAINFVKGYEKQTMKIHFMNFVDITVVNPMVFQFGKSYNIEDYSEDEEDY